MGLRSFVSKAVGAVRSVTGGLAGAIQGVASAAGSAVSNIASAARGITGKVYDEIGALAQKIGNTVEKIASDPKMLAAVAVNFAFPGAGSAIGNWILGAETAAAIGAAATTAIGNACLNTAMNGGDMKKGIETAVTSYVGNVGAQEITKFVQNAELVPDAFAKNVGTTTSYAAIQTALGKDPTAVLLTGGANACAQLLVQEVPGFSEMPKATQEAITKATASALQGKSGGAVNAAIDFATTFAKDEYKSYKDANDNGFGYDAAAWKDAKAIGITDLKDYQYAKEIGANNPYDLQIGKAIGAKDNSDLTLAKDIGLTTSDDFNYAKQIGVNNKDDFNLAKDIGAQNALDIDFAKQLGIDTSNDFNYARNIGAATAEDYDLAKTIGVKDATDLNVAKQFGITDKDTFNQYSDFLGHGTEKASTSTIKGADGTELTVDNEGNLVKYTYQGEGGAKDITDEVQKVASKSGGYTIRGDDGSTITINPDGTVSATEAVEGFYDVPGTKKPQVSYAKLIDQALKNRSVTQQTEQGGVNKATADATQRMRDNPLNKTGYQVTGEDIMSLLPLFFGGEQSYTPQQTGEGGAEGEGLAQVDVGGPEGSDINYLANLGGKPSYLGSLEKEQPTEGAQVEPGKDAGAASRGAVFGPPVGAGGGGAGPDRYSGGYGIQETGGGAGYDVYSRAKTAGGPDVSDLVKSLQDAGLEDQSAAETARLMGAQGPVAIGRVPSRIQSSGLPALPARVADINTLPSGEQISPPATLAQMPTYDPTEQIKKLQEYAASLKTYDPTEQLKKLQSYASMLSGLTGGSSQAKKQGTTAYKDIFGNVRTY